MLPIVVKSYLLLFESKLRFAIKSTMTFNDSKKAGGVKVSEFDFKYDLAMGVWILLFPIKNLCNFNFCTCIFNFHASLILLWLNYSSLIVETFSDPFHFCLFVPRKICLLSSLHMLDGKKLWWWYTKWSTFSLDIYFC